MKAKVNVMAKPHPYIFFTLQLDSAWVCSEMYHKFTNPYTASSWL